MITVTHAITVCPDPHYEYVVTSEDGVVSLSYIDRLAADAGQTVITFGSKEELIAVARAMLEIANKQ